MDDNPSSTSLICYNKLPHINSAPLFIRFASILIIFLSTVASRFFRQASVHFHFTTLYSSSNSIRHVKKLSLPMSSLNRNTIALYHFSSIDFGGFPLGGSITTHFNREREKKIHPKSRRVSQLLCRG